MEEKNFLKSKTFWINALAVGGGILTALSGKLQLGGTLTIAGVVNIVLRSVTNSNITLG